MIDPHVAVRSYLASVGAITALTSTARIYAGRNIPPPGYKPDQGSAITFQIRGGLTDYMQTHLNPSMQFKCYGLTEVSAMTLYRALFDALRSHAGGNIKSVQVEVLGQPLEEPDTRWNFVLSFFRFWMRA